MILCSCCERRIGQSMDPCGCDEAYFARCLLCKVHCRCPADEPVIVADVDKALFDLSPAAW
jgi:hypothetical protein